MAFFTAQSLYGFGLKLSASGILIGDSEARVEKLQRKEEVRGRCRALLLLGRVTA
jgi:hypothetical protein